MPAPIDIAAAAWHYYQGASAQSEAATERAPAGELLKALSLDSVPDQAHPPGLRPGPLYLAPYNQGPYSQTPFDWKSPEKLLPGKP
jgi:hypothetical protein